MAVVEVTISGVLYDKLSRTTQQVVLVGEGSLTGLGVGGGPMPPGEGGPPGIWGPTDPRPGYGLPEGPGGGGKPPGIWGPPGPWPTPPIHLPPEITPVPPNVTVPPPGSPPVVLPGTTPVHPITPPEAVMIEYPGIGKVVVPQPLTAQPK